MRLIYDPSAEADLHAIFDYIAHHNPPAAEDTIIRLEHMQDGLIGPTRHAPRSTPAKRR